VKTNILNRLRQLGAALTLTATLAGCGWVHEGITECPAQLRLKFVYDYNMKFADAFPAEVKSVNVWAFDSQTGAPVWSGAASGAELTPEGGYIMETTLDAGTYDFVAWCGLTEGSALKLATYQPASKQELEVTLQAAQEETRLVSDTELPGLYHGMVSAYTYAPDVTKPDYQTVTVPLTKDTNAVRVLLQNLDGREINPADFTVEITDANSMLAWDNAVLAGPTVTYTPWEVRYGSVGTGTPNAQTADASRAEISTVATMLNELSLSRLIAGQESWLTVTRNTDGQRIIHIPLIDYLLLIKGHYGSMSDQEYLDRQDDYSILFFIDATNNWYIASGIYINSWAVVPPQTGSI